jgi:hypothetical protein
MHSLVQFAHARSFLLPQTLLKQAWLAATLAGDEQIRSIHLLTAMVETSGLTRCDGLWPLMTLTTSQLERLRPLLEAQSDERHDVALSEQPGNVSIIGRAAPLQHEAQNQAEGGSAQPAVSQEESVLNRFTVDVTARAREGKLTRSLVAITKSARWWIFSPDAGRTTRSWWVSPASAKRPWLKAWRYVLLRAMCPKVLSLSSSGHWIWVCFRRVPV